MNNAPIKTYSLTGCSWEITLKCPLNCIHCGSKAGMERSRELSLEECFGVADQIYDLGCKSLTMIGGEVFLFRGWDQVCRRLTDKGIRVNIVTNGYRLNEDFIEQIRNAGLANIGLSIDGMQENHNYIRGKADVFQRLHHSFDLLHKSGISTGAVTSLTNFNCGDLEDIYAFLAAHDVRVWQLQLVIAMGNMAGKKNLIVNRDQVKQVIKFIRRKNLDRRMVIVAADSIGYFDENETYIRGNTSPLCFWGGCVAGISNVFIDSAGNVKGCGALYDDRFIEGNLRSTALADIWNDPNAFAYNRRFTTEMLKGKCAGCDVGALCKGGCRSANFFTSSSLYTNSFCVRKP